MQQISGYTIKFNRSFEKDLKKLKKRFNSLPADIKVFCKFSLPQFIANHSTTGYFRVADTDIVNPKFYICKKIASKSLAGKGVNSGLRLTFSFDEEYKEIYFLELFYKGDKELEDFSRFKPDSDINR